MGSTNGTEITYDIRGAGKRRNFVWVIGGDRVTQRTQQIVITITEDLRFRVVVPKHDITSSHYIDKVKQFLKGTADPVKMLTELKVQSQGGTARQTGAHTPTNEPIILKTKIGEGTFGVVSHLWDVSTAAQYALKEPTAAALKYRQIVLEWKEEARLMGKVSHVSRQVFALLKMQTNMVFDADSPTKDHIVALISADFTTNIPRLFLQYAPEGTLDQHTLSIAECVKVLCQASSALAYLHGHNPPILHRDIKPNNILVRSRDEDLGTISILLADFGYSKEGPPFKTIGGTPFYYAPEMLIIEQQHMMLN